MSRFLVHHWTAFSLAVLTIAAGWIALTAFSSPETTEGRIFAPQPGFLAPDFELQTLDGQALRLSEQQGHPVILNLWASWCLPCRTEMPALQRVHEMYADQGLVVLGLNTTYQDRLADVQQFTGDYGVSFPILLDTDGQTSRNYRLNALPTTFYIRADGSIADLIIGGPMSEAFLRSKAQELLAEGR